MNKSTLITPDARLLAVFAGGLGDGRPHHYIIHTISTSLEKGQVPGTYVVTLKDGRQFKVPVVYGRNIGGKDLPCDTGGARTARGDLTAIAREALPIRIADHLEYLLPIALPDGSEVMSFVYRPFRGHEDETVSFMTIGTFLEPPAIATPPR